MICYKMINNQHIFLVNITDLCVWILGYDVKNMPFAFQHLQFDMLNCYVMKKWMQITRDIMIRHNQPKLLPCNLPSRAFYPDVCNKIEKIFSLMQIDTLSYHFWKWYICLGYIWPKFCLQNLSNIIRKHFCK